MKNENCKLYVCPEEYCTDNATMIAWAGIERIVNGFTEDSHIDVKQDWSLSDLKLDRWMQMAKQPGNI